MNPKPAALVPTPAPNDASRLFAAQAEWFSYLYGRYLDEHEYETATEYQTAIVTRFEKHPGVTVGKFTVRPFAIEFTTVDGKYRMKATTRSVMYAKIS